MEILLAGGNHPDSGEGDDINNDCLAVVFWYRGTKVLLPGDASRKIPRHSR